MADIRIVKKKTRIWPWLLVAAIVILGIVGVMTRDDYIDTASLPRDDVAATTGSDISGAGAMPPAVAAYLQFAEMRHEEAGPAHDYAAGGIRRLATALTAVVDADSTGQESLSEKLAAFRAKADRLQQDPQSRKHADVVRDVSTSAADLMASLQQERFPEADDLRDRIDDLRQAAEAIEANRPLLEQKEQVATFFDRAGEALRGLSERQRS